MAIAPEDALGLDEAAEALDNGWTLPARWYSDPDVAELEHQQIFARSWTLLCPEAKLASPGDHVVGQLGPRARRGHARRRGQAARLRQRLPAPRAPGGDEGRLPQAAAVPLPRLDVHARRQAAERAAHVARDGLRPRGLSLVPGRRRHLARFRVRQSRRHGAAPARRPSGARAARDRAQPRLRRLEVPRRTGSTPSRPTGRSSSRTRPSATTARRCTRRASATPS